MPGVPAFRQDRRVAGLRQCRSHGGPPARRLRREHHLPRYPPRRHRDPEIAARARRSRWIELLERSDVLSLHVPLTEVTRDIIGADAIARMKTGAILINAARGEVVDEAALYDALVSGKLHGAGLDVFAKEPADPNNKLFQSRPGRRHPTHRRQRHRPGRRHRAPRFHQYAIRAEWRTAPAERRDCFGWGEQVMANLQSRSVRRREDAQAADRQGQLQRGPESARHAACGAGSHRTMPMPRSPASIGSGARHAWRCCGFTAADLTDVSPIPGGITSRGPMAVRTEDRSAAACSRPRSFCWRTGRVGAG